MPQTQTQCPNCKQPVLAEVQQLFDVGHNPQDKERLLGGAVNFLQCPQCGYRGSLGTPIVYHDPAKELLLTFFPPEMNKTMEEQERIIGPLIQKAVDNLPQEQRKGYLFKPQQMFTYQTLIETILQGDGITKEMLDAQQKRMDLIQRLAASSDEGLEEIVKQEAELVDAEFFALFNRILQGTLATQDEDGIKKLTAVQEALLKHTEFGRQLKEQADEIEAARKSLADIGQELTREKLLDLLIEAADNEVRLNALASMTRSALDYAFFQTLSERIEAAEAEAKDKLVKLREDLLEITKQLDEQMQARLLVAAQNLEALIQSDNPADALAQNPGVLDDFFIQVLNQSLQEAEENKDQDRLAKLQALLQLIQQLVSPGYNPALVQEMLEAADDKALAQIVEAHKDEITPQFVESLSGMMMQLHESDDQEMADKVRAAYRAALKASMQRSMEQAEEPPAKD